MTSDKNEIRIVEYKNNKYAVCKCIFKNMSKLFVTDALYVDKMSNYKWLMTTDTYIRTPYATEDNEIKALYLHNFIMNKLTFLGKGQHMTIDHINRVPRDNRKENLREITQSEQNYNQNKKTRTTDLPEECGINSNDIPKYVTYCAPNGDFGEYFAIDIKDLPDGSRFRKKSTKSTKISLKCKLEEVKKYLNELYVKYPNFFDNRNVNNEYSNEAIELIKSFNDIIELSKYDCWKENLADVPDNKQYTQPQIVALPEAEQQLINNISINNTSLKKKTTKPLPAESGINNNDIPKYCYYKPASDKRGDKFIIERHPALKDKRQWSTTESRAVTTKAKFELLKQKLQELESK